MIRKDYLIKANTTGTAADGTYDIMQKEITDVVSTSFLNGAVVELKIIEGVDINNGGKTFSKLRIDIISNTEFDKFRTLLPATADL